MTPEITTGVTSGGSSNDDDDQFTYPQFLAKIVDARLRELGMSRLAASELGHVSLPTLDGLADRIPTAATLANLDVLLSWEPGTAAAVLYGRDPRSPTGGNPPQPHYLAKFVHARLRDLGMSVLAASNLGYVSRSTLSGLADRVPTATTLANLDVLLEWEPGSAQGALYGRDPVPREHQQAGARRPAYDPDAADNYPNLTRCINSRLRELNLSKVRFAEISDVGRSTLYTLGRRGNRDGKPFTPTPQTLERIDTHLLWEPGSAMAALKGGVPIRRDNDRSPHPSLIPIIAVKERLRVLAARLSRQRDAADRAINDVTEMQRHIELLYGEAQEFRHTTPTTSDAADDDTAR